MKSNWKN